MTGQLFANNATSTLTQSISDSATLVNIQLSDASKFPNPVAVGAYFLATIEDKNQNPVLREIVKCTSRSNNQLTVQRAQENTTAVAFNAGVTLEIRVTAGTLDNLIAAAPTQVTLYLGTFASAPSSGVGGAVLIPGNLYFDSSQHALFEYDGAFWNKLPVANSSLQFGVYLGSFSLPPIVMPDGSALKLGALYYDTGLNELLEWNGSAWVDASTATTNVINNDGSGNTTATNGLFTNLTVTDTTSTGKLLLDGQEVVSEGDISGDPTGQHFPAGMWFQWGVATITGFTTTVPFPRAYSDVPYSVTLGLIGTPVNATIRHASMPTALQFTVAVEDTGNHGVEVPGSFFWMAVGPSSS